MNHPHLTNGVILKKCDVPLIKECTVRLEPKIRTDKYDSTNNTWNTISWNPILGYKM